MRFPRPRLTVRRLMIAVAVLALLTGVIAMLIQSERHRQRAVYHAKMELETRHLINFYQGDLVLQRGENRADYPAKLVLFTARNLYHSEMKRKWEDAAHHPWLSVAPDPPEPE
jgi:hypothetical protein